jgi:dimethylaniline monooxygenase (N-oxide forming)
MSRANQFIPLSIQLKFHPGLVNNKVDFRNFGLEPSGTLMVTQFPILSDHLHHRIITGSIQVKADIKEIAQNSVTLNGDEILENIDALVIATGFKPKYPFAKEIIEVKDDFYIRLYKHMFLPEDGWHTLAVIGAMGVGGPVPPVCEMQARVAAEVFAGRCGLPSKEKMENEIAKWEQRWLKTGASQYNFMRVSTSNGSHDGCWLWW